MLIDVSIHRPGKIWPGTIARLGPILIMPEAYHAMQAQPHNFIGHVGLDDPRAVSAR